MPVINEGERIKAQLGRMRPLARLADVIIADGGSTDGSLAIEHLRDGDVRTLLVKRGAGRLGAQLRMGFAYAIDEGYEGVVTVDGNGKDGVEALPLFLAALDRGTDFVQGSRFIDGGHHAHTPLIRLAAIRLVHAPMVDHFAAFRYTDTTNGFRAHSRRLLLEPRLQLFREVFEGYELLPYISIRAPRVGLSVCEVPVGRVYPAGGRTPTKLSRVSGSVDLLRGIVRAGRGHLDPPSGPVGGG